MGAVIGAAIGDLVGWGLSRLRRPGLRRSGEHRAPVRSGPPCRRRAGLPPGQAVPPAGNAVLLINPRSGGGKAERVGLVEECRARGIEPVVLRPGRTWSPWPRPRWPPGPR